MQEKAILFFKKLFFNLKIKKKKKRETKNKKVKAI